MAYTYAKNDFYENLLSIGKKISLIHNINKQEHTKFQDENIKIRIFPFISETENILKLRVISKKIIFRMKLETIFWDFI